MVKAFKSPEGRNSVIAGYDSLLSRWPVPYEELDIPTRCGNTHVIACGDTSAPPLVLLHGSASNSVMWGGDVEEFSKSHRVYAVDIPGEPGKSDETRQDFNTPAYLDWLVDVFNAMSIKKASVVGLSLGGWMALKLATAFPDRVEKLVLLCPSGIGRQKLSFLIYTIPLMLMGSRGERRIFKSLFRNVTIAEEAAEYIRLINKHFNFINCGIPVYPDEKLKRLTMPVLLIVGGKDTLLDSKETIKRVKKLIPHADVKLLRDAGHVLINLACEISAFLTDRALLY